MISILYQAMDLEVVQAQAGPQLVKSCVEDALCVSTLKGSKGYIQWQLYLYL